MPDEILAQREGVLRIIRRAVVEHEAMAATGFPAQNLTPGSGLGAPGGEAGPPATFATGYDSGSGLTTAAFMFDLSVFDGGDTLT